MQVELTKARDAQEGLDLPKINQKELVILSEIGLELIPTATSFVEYVSEKYGVSASGIWYTLKKLKKLRVVDFMEKGESLKPLSLTDTGREIVRKGSMELNARPIVGRYAQMRVGITL